VYLSVDKHFYSVPHAFISKKVRLLYDGERVEIYHRHERIALHPRPRTPHNYSTDQAHLTSNHQRMAAWSPDFFLQEARTIDPTVEDYIGKVLNRKQHPDQAYRSCTGILALARRVGAQRLIAACRRAHHHRRTMMNQQTLERLTAMKLHGMARAFESSLAAATDQQITPDELLDTLITAEWDERASRKQERSIKNAHFRYKAMTELIDFGGEREGFKNQILRLTDCSFIGKQENVLITGSTGLGKSYIASAIGHRACTLGYRVLYEYSNKLFARLKLAKADGSYVKDLARIERQDLLIIDDFGLQPLDAQSRAILMEVIEDRHGTRSTLFTSQVPVDLWHEVIGEQTVADAILDRMIHDAHRLQLTGDSLRKRNDDKLNQPQEITN